MATMRRSELRQIEQAARAGWETPEAERQRSIAAVQEVLDAPDASDSMKSTARQVTKTLEAAGWVNAAV